MSETKDLPVGNRLMDRAWFRDRENVTHSGEALVLACLIHVKKRRTAKDEEELKQVLDVYGNTERQKKTSQRGSKAKN